MRISATSSLAGDGDKVFAAQSGINYAVEASANAQVFAYTEEGALSSITANAVVNENERSELQFTALPYPDREGPLRLHYAVLNEATIPGATSIELVTAEPLHQQEADYLVIAHPQFMGVVLDLSLIHI